jgi:NADH-quinone oxidoreductase subunit L
VFSEKTAEHGIGEGMLQIIASIVSLAGIFIAYLFFVRVPQYADRIAHVPILESIRKFFLAGWDFDAMYDRLFIRPFMWLSRTSRHDFIDSFYTVIAALNRMLSTALSKTQTGNIRWYAMGIVVGAVVFLGIVVFLQ